MENKDSVVLTAANKTNFWQVWEKLEEAIPTGNKYLDNLEMHYCEARKFEDAGLAPEEIAKRMSFETLEQMFISVAEQAEEDFEIRAFG